jgi:uncharacterized protein (DUF697 family)
MSISTDETTTVEETTIGATDLDETALAERSAWVESTIKNHVIVAMSLGLVPIPMFDLALLIGNQVAMVNALSTLYEVPFKENVVKSIIISLVTGIAPVIGIMGLSVGIKLLPGIGSLFGSGSVAVTGGAVTYAVGQVFAKHFESGGTLLTFDVNAMREAFKKEFKEGQQAAANVEAQSESEPQPTVT